MLLLNSHECERKDAHASQKLRILILAALVLAVVVSVGVLALGDVQREWFTVTVNVHVVNCDTGGNIGNAEVTIFDPEDPTGPWTASADTDDGNVSIPRRMWAYPSESKTALARKTGISVEKTGWVMVPSYTTKTATSFSLPFIGVTVVLQVEVCMRRSASGGDDSPCNECRPFHDEDCPEGQYCECVNLSGTTCCTCKIKDEYTTTSGGTSFYDYFSNSASGWPVGGAFHYTGGGYEITCSQWNSRFWAFAPSTASSNFAVAVEALPQSSGSQEYGIIWGLSDATHYTFTISTTGLYRLSRKVNNHWERNPISWTSSSAIHQGRRTNKLRVVREGNYVSLFVNDTQLRRIQVSAQNSVAVGLVVGTSSNTTYARVRFDNFVIAPAP